MARRLRVTLTLTLIHPTWPIIEIQGQETKQSQRSSSFEWSTHRGLPFFLWVGRRARGAREHVSRSLDDVIACLGPSPSGQSSRLVAMCEMIQVGRGGGIWRMSENDWLLAASVDLSSTPLKGKGKGKKVREIATRLGNAGK